MFCHVQATFSNYSRVHGGSPPEFLGYFLGEKRGRTIYSKLQTEGGGRFLFKSNLNMVVQVEDGELEVLPERFIWLTLRQIARLLCRDNLIHACARSILAALLTSDEGDIVPVGQGKGAAGIGGSIGETVQWLDDRKAGNHMMVKRCALAGLKEWGMDRDGSFSHEEGRFFRVIGIEVESGRREVSSWNQPILDNPGTGIIGLLTRVKRGITLLTGATLEGRALAQNGAVTLDANTIAIATAPTSPVLQSAALPTGPYTDATGQVVNPASKTITVPLSGGAQFYRIRAGTALAITSISIVGGNVVITHN